MTYCERFLSCFACLILSHETLGVSLVSFGSFLGPFVLFLLLIKLRSGLVITESGIRNIVTSFAPSVNNFFN